MTLFRRLARFADDRRGSLSVEACLTFPMIVWIYFATFTYFETFRADSVNIKAAYTIGDMLSRETNPVDPAYVDGLNGIFSYITVARQPTWIRVSSVRFDDTLDDFVLEWSSASAGHNGLQDVEPIRASIPGMAPGDSVVVVETYMPYVPEFNIGLRPFTFRNVVVTRPRFAPQLCWESCAV